MIHIPARQPTLGLLVLAGGASSRMGRDKATLSWRGHTLLTDLLLRSRAVSFADIILAANNRPDISSLPAAVRRKIRAVPDAYCGCGPLGGMEAGLRHGTSDWYLVLSVDLPFYDFSPVDQWRKTVSASHAKYPAILLPVAQGQEEPLAAFYNRRAVFPHLQPALTCKQYGVRQLCRQLPVQTVPASAYSLYTNINTPSAYADALARDSNTGRAVPLVTISSSQSGQGKTALAEKVIHELTRRGYAVGYIKSTHHEPTGEKAGSDTARARRAGAAAAVLCTPSAVLSGQNKTETLLCISQRLPVALASIESRCHGPFPRLIVTPSATIRAVSPDPETAARRWGRSFSPRQIEPICDYIVWLCQKD